MNDNQKTASEHLLVPRLSTAGAKRQLEVVGLYNHVKSLLKNSRWPEFPILPLSYQYPKWQLLYQRCQREKIDALDYMRWIIESSELEHPVALLGFSLSNGSFWRYLQSLRTPNSPPQTKQKQNNSKFGEFGDRLIDDRNGRSVDWIFDAHGELLITPPSHGEVFDQQGHRIQLRRRS